jgi:CRP-like cAMP-binding protein
MARTWPAELLGNRLLTSLRSSDFARLAPHLELVPLEFNQSLCEVGSRIEHYYFPTSGVISAVLMMEDGHAIEVATIGNEGMTALPLYFEPETSPTRLIVQIAGMAARIQTDVLRLEMSKDSSLRVSLERYQSAFVSHLLQLLACNGIHSIQKRCCRWLLFTHDRVAGDVLPISHELMAMMLGVRRASITENLLNLKALGYVDYNRGCIHVLNRQGLESAACECYRTVTRHYEHLFTVESVNDSPSTPQLNKLPH